MIQGEKVYLKLMEEADVVKRAEWINDPEIQKTLNYDVPTSVSKTRAWFHHMQMDATRREFSIFDAANDEYIGFCGLFHIEVPAMKAEIHCVIGEKSHQGQGFGTESWKLLTDYGFMELGLNRIYAHQLVHNIASQRLTEKLCWTREGLLRKDLYSHGSLKDRYLTAILREDWLKERQSLGQ
ncbi:hypothetical protein ABB02_00690 [Clostridiaceae bacterium JG1575]|nr:hypothetical protein ABB02_00690 [Clostridiaceae bacterium JG1575]